MFGMETQPQEVSLTLSAPELLLCGNSGAALEWPQFPCEPISLHVPSKLRSSFIIPFRQSAPPVFCQLTVPRRALYQSQTLNHPKLCCFSLILCNKPVLG